MGGRKLEVNYDHIVQVYGIPTAILALLIVVLWRVAIWSEKVVVTPLVTNLIVLIQTLSARIPMQCQKLDGLVESSNRQNEAIANLQKSIDAQTSTLKATIDTQTKILGGSH